MESNAPCLPGVAALRESFGDGKPPEISRKITACVACRRQKIKCHMTNGKAPCARCKKRSLPCTVNRSLQMLLEDDISWKQAVGQRVQRLEHAIGAVAKKLDMPELRELFGEQAELSAMLGHGQRTTPAGSSSSSSSSHVDPLPDHSWQITVDPQCEPSSMPASCIAQVPGAGASAGNASRKPHLVSKGLISLEEARVLFAVYQDRLDHLLYRILGDDASLEAAMESSPLLTAAVCTVGALHSAQLGHLYDACLAELKMLFTTESLSRQHNTDDVRGLCIGGFWLSSLSWASSGSAVRIASEIQLHHAIYKALEGDRDAYLKTRLYYHVYVCDHHTSVLYGRPPMSHECVSINSAAALLETEHAVEDDVRLVSQVKIWSVYGAIFDCFGTETAKPVSPSQMPQLRRFAIALDTWHADWRERFRPHEKVGNYPAKGVGLHFNFAKLYLCSHAFRGLHAEPGPEPEPASTPLAPELHEVANTAVVCAASILGALNADQEVQLLLNGLSLCFDMMITFAVVFLLKVVTKYPGTIWMDKARILDLVSQTVCILDRGAALMNQRHLLVSVGPALRKLLQKVQETPSTASEAGVGHAPSSRDASVSRRSEMDWVQNFGSFEDFDFYAMLPDPNSWSVDLDFGGVLDHAHPQ
ncbi:hypothetical protein H634G_09792 [Metarhizium anisopliae BRIP 53293]|uniref:Zn(2)-C6 fungal-type domain-containing protein n=1 Tax=Metarhizium anisopliae BRIP 53293 TaxID=1291518 RepID=A0A0D9NMG0_METAN|nr:hypothetical protein H634G_09792 [Metarhizium anisopliae BRIP 53293]KJK90184.1 hypothetical protein H633G_05956 [Metarhizium anisopliae BRIP 53284]